jgi:hypothetical protein
VRADGDRPDEPLGELVIGPWDLDTDGDGVPDSILVDDDGGPVAATDLDGDGLADQILRLAPVDPGGPLLAGTVFGPLLMDAAFPDDDHPWWLPPDPH